MGKGGSSRVATYCLDFSRKSPKAGIAFNEVLSGSSQAIVVFSNTEDLVKMSLDDALAKGLLKIEGTHLVDGRGKEFLEEIVTEARRDGNPNPDLEALVQNWNNLSNAKKSEIEYKIAEMYNLLDMGDHSSMRFINNTDYEVEIKLDKNLQVGSSDKDIPIEGVDKIDLSSSHDKQGTYQALVWANREKENLEKLKIIGFYGGSTEVSPQAFEAGYTTGSSVYRRYQLSRGIDVSAENLGVLDELTDKHLQEEIKIIKSNLSSMGLDETDLKESIKKYQQYKSQRPSGYFTDDQLKVFNKDVKKGIFYSRNGNYYESTFIKGPDHKEERFIIAHPSKQNILIKAEPLNLYHLDETIERLNNRKYLQEEVEIVSLVRNTETNEKLRELFPNNHLEFNPASMGDFVKKLRSKKGKSIIVLGHVEGSYFVTQTANGKFKIGIHELKRLGQELDVNIFPLGCNSAFEVSDGIPHKFNSIEALNRLKPALDNNKTILGFLQDLSGNDFKVVIDDQSFSNKGYIDVKLKLVNQSVIVAEAGTAGFILYETLKEED